MATLRSSEKARGYVHQFLPGALVDHGSLNGLEGDDHLQYHNDTRGDARYYTKTLLDGGQLDNRYYTETEVDTLLSGKSDTGHTHAASDVVSGTFANARISEASVTQHQAAIDHDALTNFVAAEHIDWSVTGAEDVHVDRISQAAVTQHQAALSITESQISDLQNYLLSSAVLGLDTLTDPDDDRILFWDDSAGTLTWLDIGTGLTLSGTTLTADAGAGGSTTLTGLDDTDISGSQATGALLYWNGADWEDTDQLRANVGTNVSLELYDGDGESATLLKFGSGPLDLRNREHGETVRINAEDAGGSVQQMFVGDPDGAVSLYYDGSQALLTTDNGFDVYEAGREAIRLEGVSGSSRNQMNSRGAGFQFRLFGEPAAGGSNLMALFDPDGQSDLYNNGSLGFRVENNGVEVYSQSADALVFLENSVERKAQLWWDDSAAMLKVYGVEHGSRVSLVSEDSVGTSKYLVVGDPDGSVDLYHEGVLAFNTDAVGAAVRDTSGVIPVLKFLTDSGTHLGSIRHRGASRMEMVSLENGTSIQLRATTAGGAEQVLFSGVPGSGAGLYHNGVKVISTSSNGATVTDGTDLLAIITSAGTFSFRGLTNSANFNLQSRNSGGATTTMFSGDPDGSVDLYHDGSLVAQTETTGFSLQDSAGDNPVLSFRQDSGTRNVFMQSLASGDFRIRNQVHGGSITLQAEDSGGTVRTLLQASPDGSVDLYYEGVKAFETTFAGGKSDNLGWISGSLYGVSFNSSSAVWGDIPSTAWAGIAAGNTNMGSDVNNNDLLLIARTTAPRGISFWNDPSGGGTPTYQGGLDRDGSWRLYYDGTEEFRTADSNATDFLSGAEVKEYGGSFRQVGFLDMTRSSKSGNHTMDRSDWGKLLRWSTTTGTLTLNTASSVPDYVMTTVIALNVAVTIAQGSGVTITWMDGATSGGQTGNRTLAAGGVCTIWKNGDSSYYIWGNGLS